MASNLNNFHSLKYVTMLVHEARDNLEDHYRYRLHPAQKTRDLKIRKIVVDRFIKGGALINELIAEMKRRADEGFSEKVFIALKIDTLFDLFKHVYKDFTNPELDRLVRQPISGDKPSNLHARLDALEYANFDPALKELAEQQQLQQQLKEMQQLQQLQQQQL